MKKNFRNFLTCFTFFIACCLSVGLFAFSGLYKIYAEGTPETGGFAVIGGNSNISLDAGVKISNFHAIDGGAFYVSGSLTVKNGTISENIANKNGGAFFIEKGGVVNINGGKISGNSAEKGDGAYVNGGTLKIDGGTFNDDIYFTDGSTILLNKGILGGKVVDGSSYGRVITVSQNMNLSNASFVLGDKSRIEVEVDNNTFTSYPYFNVAVSKTRKAGEIVKFNGKNSKPYNYIVSGYDEKNYYPLVVETDDGWSIYLANNTVTTLSSNWKTELEENCNINISEVSQIVFTTKAPNYSYSSNKIGDIEVHLQNNALYLVYNGKICAPRDSSNLFNGFEKVKGISFSNFYANDLLNASYMFANCSSLESLDIIDFDFSGVSLFTGMFSGCETLSHLDCSLDTPVATDMSFMYSGCKNLKDDMDHHYFGGAENGGLKSIRGMFSGCENISVCYLNELYTTQVTDMSYVFDGCKSLTSVEFGSSSFYKKVKTMRAMFKDCVSLSFVKTSSIETIRVSDFSSMFENCGISEFDGIDTSCAENMSRMFYNAPNLYEFTYAKIISSTVNDISYMFGCDTWLSSQLKLVDLGGADTSNVTTMAGLFQGRKKLENIYGFDSLDTSKVTNTSRMFSYLPKLQGLDISGFSADSLVSYSNMFDFSGESINTLGTTIINKIICPKGLPFDIPFSATGKFYREDSMQITSSIPGNLSESISLKILDRVELTSDWESFFSRTAVENLIFDTNVSELSYSKIGETSNGISIYQSLTNGQDYAIVYLGEIYAPNVAGLFSGFASLKNIIFNNFNTSEIVYMNNMFDGCFKLKSLDLSSFDTNNVVDMSQMFIDCRSLESVNLSSFKTFRVEKFREMFYGCAFLKELDLGSFHISEDAAVEEMLNFGNNCPIVKLVAPYSCPSTINVSAGTRMCYPTIYGNYTIYKSLGNQYIEQGRTYVAGIDLLKDDVQSYHYATKFVFSNQMPSSEYSLSKTYENSSSVVGYSVYEFEKNVWFYFPGIMFAPSDCSELFADFESCAEYVFDNFNTQEVLDMSHMFLFNYSLEKIDISMFSCPLLKTVESMFMSCKEIKSIKLFASSTIENMSKLFDNCVSLERVDLSMINTENVKTMKGLFACCRALKSVDFWNFDTSKLSDMSYMFYECYDIESIDFSSFVFDNIENISYLFSCCSKLKNIVFSSNIDSQKLQNMSYMFAGCSVLETVDLSMFSTKNVTDVSYMFKSCKKLKTLDLSNFDLSSVSSSNLEGMLSFDSDIEWIKTPINAVEAIPINVLCVLYDVDTLETVTEVPKNDKNSHKYAQSLIFPKTWKAEVNGMLPSGLTVFSNILRIYFEQDETFKDGSVTFENIGKLSTNIDVYYSQANSILIFYAPMTIKLPSNSSNLFSNLSAKSIAIRNVSSSGVENMSFMFAHCSRLTGVNFGDLDTSSVTNMSYMFYNCSSMIGVYMVNQNTSNVTNMAAMFSGCSSLTHINVTSEELPYVYKITLNTQNVTNMSSMFEGCSSLVGGIGDNVLYIDFNTKSVKDFSRMFAGCLKIEYLEFSSVSFLNATNMNAMFKNCKGAVQIRFDFDSDLTGEKITNMSSMFAGCILLEDIKNLEKFRTSSLQEMNYMFLDCQYLSHIKMDEFDLSNVTETSCAFEGTNISVIVAPKIIPNSVEIDLYSMLYDKTSEEGYNSLNNLNQGLTLYKRLTITVNANNGTLSYTTGWTITSPNAKKYVYYSDTISRFVTVSRTGYTLQGFYTGISSGSAISSNQAIFNDYTLYARWAKTPYTLTFNANEGETSTTSKTIYYQQAIGTVPIPTRAGYTFLGWSRNYFDFSKIINKYGVCIESGDGQFTLKPTSTTQTTYALAVSKYNNSSFVSTIMTRSVTGRCSYVFTKTSSFNRLQFKYKGDIEEAGFYYDLTGLVDGKTYVLSLNVKTMALNNVVINDIMIEQNTANSASTYTNSYVTASTLNTATYGYTVFARWEIKTVNVNVSNLSGVGYEGSVMGNSSGTYSTTLKYGDSFTITYSPNGKYTFAKIVKGLNWFGDTINNVTYTITEADTDAGTIYFKICYLVKVQAYAVSEGDVGDSFGGKVKVYDAQTASGNAFNNWAYENPNDQKTITAIVNDGWKFVGWYVSSDCSGTAVSESEVYTFKTGTNGDLTFYAKFEPTEKMLLSTWKSEISSSSYMSTTVVPSNITKLSFATVVPDSYSQIGKLSTRLQVYANNSNANEIAFVFDKIVAPVDSSSLFSDLTALKTVSFENFDTSKTTKFEKMFENCVALTSADLSMFETPVLTNMASMFSGCKTLKIANLSNISTNNVTNMRSMFSGCSMLSSLSFSFDTSNVTDMSEMFKNCSSLTILNLNDELFDTTNVTSMASMFEGCSKLQTLNVGAKFNTGKVVDISKILYNCTSLTELDISKFNLSSVTAFDDAFNLGDNKAIELINTSLAGRPSTDIPITCDMTVGYWAYKDSTTPVNSFKIYASSTGNIFVRLHETSFLKNWKNYYTNYANVTSITFSNSIPGSAYTRIYSDVGSGIKTYYNNTTKALIFSFIGTIYAPTDCTSLFYQCSSAESINLNNFNTSNTTKMVQMFSNCSALTSIRFGAGVKTNKVTTMAQMFQRDDQLLSVDLSGFDTSEVTNFSWMFHGCSSIQTIKLSSKFTSLKATNVSWMFNGCSSLEKLDLSSMDLSNIPTSSSDNYNGMLNFTTGSSIYYFKTPKNSPVKLTPTLSAISSSTSKWYQITSSSYKALTDYSSVIVPANSGSIEYRKGFVLTATTSDGTIPETNGWVGSGNKATKIVSEGDVFGTLPVPVREDYRFTYWNVSGGSSVYATTIVSLSGATSMTISANWAISTTVFPTDWTNLLRSSDRMQTKIEPYEITSIMFLYKNQFTAYGVSDHTFYGFVGDVSVYAKKTGSNYSVVFTFGNVGKIYAPTDSQRLFSSLMVKTYIFKNFDTSSMMYADSMFMYNDCVETIDFSSCDFSRAISVYETFDFGISPINSFKTPKKTPSIAMPITSKYKLYVAQSDGTPATSPMTTISASRTSSISLARVVTVVFHAVPFNDIGYVGAGTFSATAGWTISGNTASQRFFYGSLISKTPTFTPSDTGPSSYVWKTESGVTFSNILVLTSDLDFYPYYS